MKYCIVSNKNIVENIIICDNDETAKELGATTYYDGAAIGQEYDPYNYRALNKLQVEVADLNLLVNTLTGTE